MICMLFFFIFITSVLAIIYIIKPLPIAYIKYPGVEWGTRVYNYMQRAYAIQILIINVLYLVIMISMMADIELQVLIDNSIEIYWVLLILVLHLIPLPITRLLIATLKK